MSALTRTCLRVSLRARREMRYYTLDSRLSPRGSAATRAFEYVSKDGKSLVGNADIDFIHSRFIHSASRVELTACLSISPPEYVLRFDFLMLFLNLGPLRGHANQF